MGKPVQRTALLVVLTVFVLLVAASGDSRRHLQPTVADKNPSDDTAGFYVMLSDGHSEETGESSGPPNNFDDSRSELAANAVVERVVDGDTIVARVGNKSETVRLIGIDTPESVARTRPVECYGQEASFYLAEILPVGTAITLVRDAEIRDVYDRLLAYVIRSYDSLFVNLELVSAGYAAVLEYWPNDYYSSLFARAEAEARHSLRGLWKACGGPDVPLD
ncbi:MAG: thermonuclease family protein [Acidimicrobiaceae bacterium]|nr:thermonuclease family protein [Acidimicrobiaceae bacterium]